MVPIVQRTQTKGDLEELNTDVEIQIVVGHFLDMTGNTSFNIIWQAAQRNGVNSHGVVIESMLQKRIIKTPLAEEDMHTMAA